MKNIFKLTFTSTLGIFFLFGCASKTVDIKPQPVTKEKMEKFNTYSCNQIDNSLAFLETRAQRIARVQNDDAETDKKLAAWSWLYGIPLLFLNGDGESKKEFESILGEKEALENIAIEKDCSFNRKTIHQTKDGDY